MVQLTLSVLEYLLRDQRLLLFAFFYLLEVGLHLVDQLLLSQFELDGREIGGVLRLLFNLLRLTIQLALG